MPVTSLNLAADDVTYHQMATSVSSVLLLDFATAVPLFQPVHVRMLLQESLQTLWQARQVSEIRILTLVCRCLALSMPRLCVGTAKEAFANHAP